MSKKVVLVWFRNDLRLHDNEVLTEALNRADLIIPVYCFDPRYFSKNKFNQYNTGVNRAQFLLDTVSHLKNELKGLNADLMTFVGYPEEILPKLCVKYEIDEVYHHREVATRETQISESVEAALWEQKINLRHFIGHTLFHKEDLPFPIKDIPDKFNIFKKKIERESAVRKPFDTPQSIPYPTHLEQTQLPSLLELGYSEEDIAENESKCIEGGEDKAITSLEQLLDPQYSGLENYTHISPYIAIGALSPIYIYDRMRHSDLSQNKRRYDRLMTSLLWRDYFRFMLKKYPNVFFKSKGLLTEDDSEAFLNEDMLIKWKAGETGEEQIDEAIQALKTCGNITYAVRRMLARYFTHQVSSNWLIGASFFEEYLLDYAPATTYGFWSHMAGVGTSPKENVSIDWEEFRKKLSA